MKQHRLLYYLISFLLALSIIGAVGCAGVFAAPGDPGEENPPVSSQIDHPEGEAKTPQEEQNNQPQNAQPQEEQNAQPQEQSPAQGEQEPNQWYDPIYSYDENATSSYVEPEHLGELPAVSATQVQEATSVAIPVVAVSDASLFSGIVMWLCVALGIAVVVGVLVSRRTRRHGS